MVRKYERVALIIRHGMSMSRSETGATAVEYALMISFIAAVIVTAVGMLGAQTRVMFQMGAALFP